MAAWEIIERRVQKGRSEVVVWRSRDAEGRTIYAASRSRDGVAVEPVGQAYYSKRAAMESTRMRYGYRVVGGTRREPSGLIGLATTRKRALALGARVPRYIVREAWPTDVWKAVRAQELVGRIPRDLPLSMAAKVGG
jgi:hypothetical protein